MQDAAVTDTPVPIAHTGYGVHHLHEGFVRRYDDARLAAGQGSLPREHPRARFFHLVQMLALTRGLPGATAEAGCFRGMSSYLLCHALRDENAAFDGSTHWMVDSYEGLSKPSGPDGSFAVARHGAGAFTDTSVDLVRRTMAAFPAVHLVPGWIPGVLSTLPEQRYRFVHIDVDLHDPTRDCLEYFFPRLVPGGMLVVDDYGPWEGGAWPGCRPAVDSFCARHGVPMAALDTGNAVLVRR